MKLKSDTRGVSLAIVIGLVLLFSILMATLSEIVTKALQSSREIESSDKAYFAAEAGIENALYELSNHQLGYQTPPLGSKDVRQDDLDEASEWSNQWQIDSRSTPSCPNDWEMGFSPSRCGQLRENQKLILPLSSDQSTSNGVGINEIGVVGPMSEKLELSALEIKFRLPKPLVSENNLNELLVDNDRDFDKNSGNGLNEDGDEEAYGLNACDYSNGVLIDDNDCDTREDEDSPEDPVLLWSVVDQKGNFFKPLRGCKTSDPHPSHGQQNAGLCEKDFIGQGNGELSVSLNGNDLGSTQEGKVQSLLEFLEQAPIESQMQLEILVVAPLVVFNPQNPPAEQAIPLPYLEYGIAYDAGSDIMAGPFFTLQSDGYFRDFKQSIISTIERGAGSKLLNLTIIQQ